MEIGLRTENGWHFVIGKVYAKDHSDVFQAMEGISQAGFGAREEFSIPQPLTYLSSLRLLVQEKVEGPLAKEIFETGDERSRAAAAERCARWLARFHALGPKAGPVSDSNCCLSWLRERTREIAELGGRCANKAARLLQRLEDEASSLSPVEMCAGHGSYSPAQLILAESRTVVFDWDGYDVADPARDVGRFLAALRRKALTRLGSIRAADGAAEVFLKTYLAVCQPEAGRNLRFYEAAACLKVARPSLQRQEKTEAMLDEGLQVLDRGATR
ncbi:MAG: phosphotransferase [Acidobacteria bacterium]|nr:phosphotransferase [Acidobacteriota bacterium]